MKKRINIIIPPVWSGVYLNTARLLKYSLEDQGKTTSIIEAGVPSQSDISIVLGWNLIPDSTRIPSPYIIYQLEPLVLPLWKEKLTQKRKLFINASIIWDYSKANIEYLSHLNKQIKEVPLGYHPKLKEALIIEYYDYDVLFVGFATERRKKVLNELQKHCCVSVQPRWGKDFTDALSRSKILLNIHQYDIPTPLEQPRISYALNNDCLVISEKSIDTPYKGLLKAAYDDIPELVLKFLQNPCERDNKRNLQSESFKKVKMEHCLPNIK